MKTKKILFIVVLSAVIFPYNSLKAQVIDVNEVIQEQTEWCWAGVSKCILDYYSFPVNQCEIAEYTRTVSTFHNFGNVDCCTNPNQGCNYWNYNWGTDGSIEDIFQYFGNILVTNVSDVIDLATIQTEIDNNRPFIVRWGWFNGGGHFVVGHGVNSNYINIMNPWMGEGKSIVSHSWLVNDGNHEWTHSQKMYTNPPPLSINDINKNNQKQLIKIIDILGRTTSILKNTALFYIYDDGTVEKKIFVQ